MAHSVFFLLNINKLSQFNITEHLMVLIFCHWHKKSVSQRSLIQLLNCDLTQSQYRHHLLKWSLWQLSLPFIAKWSWDAKYGALPSQAEMFFMSHTPWTNLFERRTVIFSVTWNLFWEVGMNLCYTTNGAAETALSPMKVQKSRNKLSPLCDFLNMPIKALLCLVEPVVSTARPNLKY